jgi:phosphohistidine phosphatase
VDRHTATADGSDAAGGPAPYANGLTRGAALRYAGRVTKPKPRVLYLVRHAIAAERGPAWPDDAKRPLTHKGVARMRDVVRGLRALDVSVDLVATSPLVRAKQTAEILIDGLKPAPALTVLPALAPGVVPADIGAALAQLKKAQTLALVGHEPGLGELACWLIGAKAPLPFKKGGVARIDLPHVSPAGAGQLVWLATPKMLRALG